MIYEDNEDPYGDEYLRCDCCHQMKQHMDIRAEVMADESVVFTCVECLEELYSGQA